MIKPSFKNPNLDPDNLVYYRPFYKVITPKKTSNRPKSKHEHISIVVLLDLRAAFDNIDHHILLQRLEHHVGIKGCSLSWLTSYFSDCLQFAHIHNESSNHTKVSYGIPQDSAWTPAFLFVHATPRCRNKEAWPVAVKPDGIIQLPKTETCLKAVKAWITNNFLLLNTDKRS